MTFVLISKSTPKRVSYFFHDSKIYFSLLAANVSFTFSLPDTFRLVRRMINRRHSLRRDFGHTRVVNYVPSDSAIEIKRWKGGREGSSDAGDAGKRDSRAHAS